MAISLENKVIVVTGASKGVGKELVKAFVQEGAHVFGLARNHERLQELERTFNEYSGQFKGIPCNVGSGDDVQRAFKEIYNQVANLDVLINNAGVGYYAPIEDLGEDQWDEMMDVNLKGPFLCSQAVIPHMKARKEGHIINISSVAGLTTFIKGGGYCASKHGLMAFSDVLTNELKPFGVHVSTICPGSIQTDFGGSPPKDYSLQPSDIAEAALFMVQKPQRVIINQIVMRPQVPLA